MGFNLNTGKAKKTAEAAKTTAFSKEQLVSSSRYLHRKDLVNTLLAEDKLYCFEEVDSMIDKFMKGKVN